jgi:hypothetical protein
MVDRRYRCQLERIGAPTWTCRAALTLLGALLVGYAILITATTPAGSRPVRLLLLIWSLVSAAVYVLHRGWRASYWFDDDADKPQSTPGAPSSNNDWSGP